VSITITETGAALGDTAFASMTAAYDALPAGMKKRLEGLKALQSIIHGDERAVT
jgi:alpha-ketoglutarate-dependent taurine dioxygenase